MREMTDEEALELAAEWDAYVPTPEEQAVIDRAIERSRRRLQERLAGFKADRN